MEGWRGLWKAPRSPLVPRLSVEIGNQALLTNDLNTDLEARQLLKVAKKSNEGDASVVENCEGFSSTVDCRWLQN